MTLIARPGTAVHVREPEPYGNPDATEWGVVIHAALTWLVAYFPGDIDHPGYPDNLSSIRVIHTANVIFYRELTACDPAWTVRTWDDLARQGCGLLQAPEAVRIWELAAEIARHRLTAGAHP